jgi:ankyrin repeat protein
MKKSIIVLSATLLLSTASSFANSPLEVSSLEITTNPVIEFENMYATPLVVAITKGDLLVVKKFLEYGVDVNEMTNGKTPLMYAARYNELEIAKLLIEKGAKVDIKDANNLKAVDYARISNATDVFNFLQKLK